MAKTRRKKVRTHVEATGADKSGATKTATPRSFVFRRGKLSELVKDLENDLRDVMKPHTAANLKESKGNKLKDFVQVSGVLGVSHFLMLSATEASKYVKVCKTPRGPTLSFRVHQYTLAREVLASQRNPRAPKNAFLSPPLVVLNNFGDAPHQKLATITFQNLFPAINVRKVKLSTCQRAVLIDYDKTTGRFQFRHYGVSAAPTGTNKAIRKLLTTRRVPNMGDLADVSELLTSKGYGSDHSDSEGEDAVNARVDLTQDYNRVAREGTRSRIILQEIGPRMELELVKVEEGMCEGRVLYHAYVKKTEEEVLELENKAVTKEALRKRRREEQEANVRRKEREAKEKAAMEEELAGMKKRKRDNKSARDKLDENGRKKKKGPSGAEKRRDGGDDDEAPFKRGRKSQYKDREGGGGGGSGGGGKKSPAGTKGKDKNKRPGKGARAKRK